MIAPINTSAPNEAPTGPLDASRRQHRMTVGELREHLTALPDWALVQVEAPTHDGIGYLHGYTSVDLELVDYGTGVLTLVPAVSQDGVA